MQLLPRSCRLPRQLGAQLLWLILRTQLRTCAHGHVRLPVTRRGQPAATTAADVHDPNARTATHSLVLSSETECLCMPAVQSYRLYHALLARRLRTVRWLRRGRPLS